MDLEELVEFGFQIDKRLEVFCFFFSRFIGNVEDNKDRRERGVLRNLFANL